MGGKHILPMAKLVSDLESLQLTHVRTYIQSGNVLFCTGGRPSGLAQKIEELIEQRHGFRPKVLLLTSTALKTAIANNPFPEATDDHRPLHFYFLLERPKRPDTAGMEAIKLASERMALVDQVFYLHAPDGIGRSKLAAAVEKHLGVMATARNWRTVDKLQSMLQED